MRAASAPIASNPARVGVEHVADGERPDLRATAIAAGAVGALRCAMPGR